MDIGALKQAAQAATPGPWFGSEATEALHAVRTANGRIIADVGYSGSLDRDKDNAAHIAAANPAAVLALIESHEQLVKVCGILAQVVYTQNGNLHDDINEILATAKEVLAKAGAK